MACTVTNVKIEPSNANWQDFHKFIVETVADSSSSLNNKYFAFYTNDEAFYVWYNVGAAGVDPTPIAGATAFEVAISADATAAAVASATQTVVDADADWQCTVSSNQLTITNITMEKRSTAPSAGDSGFTVTECTEGGNLDLGLLDGDISVTFDETLFEVTAHQYGTLPLADLRQGATAEVSLTLKESDTAKLKEIFSDAGPGGTYTPSGGTQMFGWGTARQGTNTMVQARRLVLKPVGAADDTGNLTFWKAYPIPGSLVISGENPKTTEVSFKIYRDEDQNSAVSFFAFGDQTQEDPA